MALRRAYTVAELGLWWGPFQEALGPASPVAILNPSRSTSQDVSEDDIPKWKTEQSPEPY